MTANHLLLKSLAASQMLMHRYLDDLKSDEFLHRPTPKANCAAWTVGHLIVTERMALTRWGVADLPPLPDGFDKRFSRDEGCPQAGEFGDVSILLPLFDQHRNLLMEAVKRATPEQLDKPIEKPHPIFPNLGELANFIAIHAIMHAGQLTTIRRSLGRPPVM